MAFTTGLRVIERSETIAYLLYFIEFGLISLMSSIVGDPVALVVKTGGGFRRLGNRSNEKETQKSQRDQESHGFFLFIKRPRDRDSCTENLFPLLTCEPVRFSALQVPIR